MIISRKRFEEELCKRRQKEEFDRRVEERLFALEDEVRTLKWKVDTLEREKNPNPVTPAYTQPQTYDPAPYWMNPSWKAPTPTCTASDVHGFTDEEMDLYWKTIQKKSVATGVNINDLFKADDKSEGER